jgi:hypothetical protein
LLDAGVTLAATDLLDALLCACAPGLDRR